MSEQADHSIGVELEYEPFKPILFGRWKATLWIDSNDFRLGHFMFKWRAVRAGRRYAKKKFKEWYTDSEHVTIQTGRDG